MNMTLSNGSARSRQLISSTWRSMGVRVAGVGVGLASMPAYMNYFEDDRRLGVWFALLSVLSFALTFDLGVGNGLRQRAVECLSRGDQVKLASYTSSSYAAAFGTTALLAGVGWVLASTFNWRDFVGVQGGASAQTDLMWALQVSAAGILVQVGLRTCLALFYALQRPEVPALMNLVSNSLILVFLLAFDRGGGGSLAFLSIVYAFAVNVPLLMATWWLFARPLSDARPRWSLVRLDLCLDVLKIGLGFLLLQLLYLVVSSANPVLIAWLADTSDVVTFQIYSRPFQVVSLLAALILAPVWSTVTKALVEGDVQWVTRLLSGLRHGLIAVFVTIGVTCFAMQFLVNLWLGGNAIEVRSGYLLLIAVSSFLLIWNTALSAVSNGAGMVMSQSVLLGIGVCLKISVAAIMVDRTGDWIWVVASDVVALLPYILIQPLMLRRFLRSRTMLDSQAT